MKISNIEILQSQRARIWSSPLVCFLLQVLVFNVQYIPLAAFTVDIQGLPVPS